MRRNIFLSKRTIKYVTIGLVTVMLAGCGKADMGLVGESEEIEEDVELIEPKSGTPSYAVAEYRTLYDTKILSALLNPEVSEYTYESEQPFGHYGKVVGDSVIVGDEIIYGNTEDIDKRIEDLSEEIEDAKKAYDKTIGDLTQDLREAKKEEAKKGTLSNSFDSDYVPLYIQGDFKRAALASDRLEQQILEQNNNFKSQSEHYDRLMNILLDEKRDVVVSAKEDGVIVAEGYYQIGDNIVQGNRVCAVADTSIKKFDTEFVNAGILRKAEDIYALVDGVRYEVTPTLVEGKEYEQLVKKNGVVFTSFYLNDDVDFNYGTYGVIVIENKVHRDVLCVPTDAIRREGADCFVNIYDDGIITKTQVKVGMKDGLFTEILSGLEAGDKVLSDGEIPEGKSYKKISYGSTAGEFSETGYLYCPEMLWIKNPAENGSCYLKEVYVEDFEQVEEGQDLVTIEIVPDNISIGRLERQIQRAKERLVVLQEEDAKDYSLERNIGRLREIRDYKENIAKLQKDLNKLTKYSGEVTLKAPFTGMVVNKTQLKAGDLLRNEERLVELCDYSECFIIVDDPEGRLGYGNDVSITFTDFNSQKQSLTGKVVTANKTALSSELMSNEAIIALQMEDIQTLISAGSAQGTSGWYRTRFTVETTIRDVENVLLVPRASVTESGGTTYVKVKTDNGTKLVSFVPGGADQGFYWVAEGLEEGMEICSD